jgi:nucleoside-diphosphate-sugar epimerase
MKKTCVITGSNGYVGGCVKKYFVARGWEVFELTRRPKTGTRACPFNLGDDISPELFSGATALVHCAYDFTPLHWQDLVAVNVEGSRKVIEAARVAGVSKIIVISTNAAFEGCRSLYGKAKLEIEKIALANGALVLRPGMVYGSLAEAAFGELTAKIQKSSLRPLIGDGSQIHYLVHNEDISAFIEKVASGEIHIPTRALTAANEQPLTLKQLMLEIARIHGKELKFVHVPWRAVWLVLKCAEACGLKMNLRSDSLISLMYPNPATDFSANAAAGLYCRPFDSKTLKA